MTVPEPVGHAVLSASNDRRLPVWVWAPPGDGPFPLLVLLHGVLDAGGHLWWQTARVHEVASRLPDPPVIVMPSDTLHDVGTGYVDWADGSVKARTHLLDEVLPWVESTYPLDGRRWVTGLSMGGFGALHTALGSPGVFASATATSGFFDPLVLHRFVKASPDAVWGRHAAAYDAVRLVADPHRVRGLRLALDCGTEDELLDESRRLHAALDAAGVAHGYAEHPGGHDWDYWSAHVEDHLRFHMGLPGPLSRSAA